MHALTSLASLIPSAATMHRLNLLPDTALATFTYLLVAYHVILIFRLMTKEGRTGLSMPIGQAIVTHLACLALVIGIGMARHVIPFFGMLRYFIPGIAPFEVNWLFNGEKKYKPAETQPDALPDVFATPVQPSTVQQAAVQGATPMIMDEYSEFLKEMHEGRRPFRKPGITVTQEYQLWLAYRAKMRAAQAADAAAAAATARVKSPIMQSR